MSGSDTSLTKEEGLFLEYYEKLIWEVNYAFAHLKLAETLNNYRSNYLRELNRAPHFFGLTLKAHRDDAVLTLSRVLSYQDDSLSVWKFLNFAEQNIGIFSHNSYGRRMKANQYYGSLVKSHTSVSCQEIENDRAKLRSLKDTIDKILLLRDKELAHIDRAFYLKGKITAKKESLRFDELKTLIGALIQILNRYSSAYRSSSFLDRFIGEDDIQVVMDAIRLDIQERRKWLENLKTQAASRTQKK